ncbi:hypothetical protein [Chamaesiphon sp.]|uniref:hypothetical protein n=1 Tax=Chamaesiphon sp. TaxID=2814140 RepID=UPI00359362C1
MLDKLVILSSVSSVEGLPSLETSQGNALRADDIADDISIADDKAENIVSHRTAEHERVSRFADDTENKNSRSTSSDRLRRFKIGDLVRYSGQSDNLQQSIYE